MNKWDLWIAKVKYEDDPNTIKRRPVLVVKPDLIYILSFKITSHPARSNYDYEYEIKKWKEAGLDKPSTIRCSKKLELVKSDFEMKIGVLHPIDIFGLQEEIRNHFKRTNKL